MTALALDPSRPTLAMLETHGPGVVVEPPTIEAALEYVRGLAKSHYENFHVLTGLVPVDLRDDFAAVYAFCRWADDLGDETGNSPEARARSLELLAWWRDGLNACFSEPNRASGRSSGSSLAGVGAGDSASGELKADLKTGPQTGAQTGAQNGAHPDAKTEGLRPSAQITHPVFVALAQTVRRRSLVITPFDNLIRAFELDQTRRHYETWDQLIDYCALSANPVGRIVLALAGYPDNAENAERYAMSDAICTALQLTNHWQDVRRDLLERDRVYIPATDTGVTPEQLRDWAARPDDPAARVPYIRMLRGLVERTWPLFEQGQPLPGLLDKRVRAVVWLFAAGGRRILRAVDQGGCTTLWRRPTLSPVTKAALLARAYVASRL